jgi:AcrR family transcriptional regulator
VPVARGETIDTERTRTKMLRAATELFYRAGTSTGVNEIAAGAAVSKLTLYRYFGSKDQLIEEVLSARSDHVIAWLRAASGASSDPIERILAVFDALRGWYGERGFRGCALVNAATENPSPQGPARRLARAHLDRYLELFTQLAEGARVADPGLVARQLVILLEGATVVAAINADPAAATDARQMAQTVLASAR